MEMKRGVIESDNYFREMFKPIIEPLKSIEGKKSETKSDNISNTATDKIEDDDEDVDQVSEFFNFFSTAPRLRTYDKTFGLHYDVANDQCKIGNFPVSFINNQLRVGDKYFPWTSGLWSLLCEKNPKGITYSDVEAYFEILKSTKVHLKADGKPKANSFFKWTNIIKPLYERMKIGYWSS